jgi:F-type H+-transporting ATPase subunit b
MMAVVVASAVALVASRVHAETEEKAKAESTASQAEAGAASEHGHEPDRNPMAFDPDLAIFSAVIFLILLGVLSWFAWPSIAAALDERERKITDNIAAAAARLEDAKRVLAEHEAKLAAAAGEVRAMIDQARRDADTTRKRIEDEGHSAAKSELDRAVREIGRARDAAVQQLAVASANVAIDLARSVVKDEISAERQKQIVSDAIGKLTAAVSNNN